ncbi:MAG: thioredoxin domain-containing protein [Solirubrobacteraceae bacterium]|nr:thioredoxin domain-containing protein [Solirubrobacteraceae bacterium]
MTARRALPVVLVAALIVAAVAMVLAGRNNPYADGRDPGKAAQQEPKAPQTPGAAETAALLEGIEQQGMVLGDPKAPVTLLEYVDLQCPFCKKHQLDVQPELIKRLVRTGEARIAFVPLAFLGPDSIAARNVFVRMAARNRAWEFAHLFFWNQGQENSGYVSDAFLRRLVSEIPGTTDADASRQLDQKHAAFAARSEALGQAVLGRHEAGTPGFAVGPSDAAPVSFAWVPIYREQPVAEQLIQAVRQVRAQLDRRRSTPGTPPSATSPAPATPSAPAAPTA